MHNLEFLRIYSSEIDNFDALSSDIYRVIDSELSQDEKVVELGRAVVNHLKGESGQKIGEKEQLSLGKWIFKNLTAQAQNPEINLTLSDEEDYSAEEDEGEFPLVKEGENVNAFDGGDGKFWKITVKHDGFYTFTYTPPKDPQELLDLFPALEPDPTQMLKNGYEEIFKGLNFLGFEFVIRDPPRDSGSSIPIYELRVPSPHRLLTLWNRYKEEMHLPDLEMVISYEGTESDVTFIRINKMYTLPISTKHELFHDYFYHLIPTLLQMIRLKCEGYLEMKQKRVAFFGAFFLKLEIMKDPTLSAEVRTDYEKRYPGIDKYLDMLIKVVGAFVDTVLSIIDENYIENTFSKQSVGVSYALKAMLDIGFWRKYFLAEMLNRGVIKHESEFEQAIQEMKTLIDLIDQ